MNMTPGDLVDKWSIMKMKLRHKPELKTQFLEIQNEVLMFRKNASSRDRGSLFAKASDCLHEVNGRIWELESMLALMRGREPVDVGLVASVALNITDINKLRVKAIEAINSIFADPRLNRAAPSKPQTGLTSLKDLGI